MARPLRLLVPYGIYHVYARGNDRAPIFRDDSDRERFLELVAEVRAEYGWRVLAYCLLGNHYHLCPQTPEPNLASGMRQLNGVYAQRFNRRHRRSGHVLEGRYGARLVQADEHLRSVLRYIVRNPVRAGLCASPSEWRFSSCRATLGEEPSGVVDVDEVLSYFGPTPELARARYREYVEQPGDDELGRHPLVHGDDAFVVHMLRELDRPPGVPRRFFREPRPELSGLLEDASDASLMLAQAHGYSLRAIAAHLGLSASTVSRRLQRYAARHARATNET
ncbi:MAG TPA: transposase [Gaiellaceae bacterium]|jgi:putative transposase|nr:transposase [Gaiellaceae bacterium]